MRSGSFSTVRADDLTRLRIKGGDGHMLVRPVMEDMDLRIGQPVVIGSGQILEDILQGFNGKSIRVISSHY